MVGGGYVALLERAWAAAPSTTKCAYTQEPCVIRMAKSSNSTTEYAVVNVYTQYGGSGQVMTTVNVSFSLSDTQYIDITDILRSGILRSLPSTSIASTGTNCRLKISEYDSNDYYLGAEVLTFTAFDAVRRPYDEDTAILPDTFRLIQDTTQVYHMCGCMRTTYGLYNIGIDDTGGNTVATYTGGTSHSYTLGWRFPLTASSVPSLVMATGSYGKILARVLWEPCDSDHFLLRWWSPTCGAFKTCAVKVRGGVYNVADRSDYVTMYDPYNGSRGGETLRCVIERCTPKDVLYYSDLYLSDYIIRPVLSAGKITTERVRISGAPPAYSLTGYADMEFEVTVSEVTSLC